MRMLHGSVIFVFSSALLAGIWSCHDTAPALEPVIAQAETVPCSDCCTDTVDDLDPDCERSLCDPGPSGYCVLSEGTVGAACQAAVCAVTPACCDEWWTEDCVGLVRDLCLDIVCPPGTCGDDHVDAGEECDDGNTDDHDGCSADCRNELSGIHCGDGYVDADEECDAGTANGSYGALCTIDCKVGGARCGDGIVQPEEQCDSGPPSYGSGDTAPETDTVVSAELIGSGSGSSLPPPEPVCAETCRWQGCGDLLCDEGEDLTCPSDCTSTGGDTEDELTCCESASDICGQIDDGTCQSGCAWGHDPDCDPQTSTTDSQCCGDPADPCGWNGDGVCDSGCAWTDVDCPVDGCTTSPDAGIICTDGSLDAGIITTDGSLDAGIITTDGSLDAGGITADGSLDAGGITADGSLDAGILTMDALDAGSAAPLPSP